MAMIQNLVAAFGPLPISGNFNTEGDGPVVFYLSGSAWSGSSGAKIGFSFSIDGQLVGVCTAYTNEATSHKTLIPVMIPWDLSYGSHSFSVTALAGTNTDVNDEFFVTLIY